MLTRFRRPLAALFLTFAAGCGPDGGSQKTLMIGMVPKLTGIPYFKACEKGADEAARELGVKLVYEGPLTADAVRQGEIVNSFILRGFDVLAVAPNNPEAIAPILRKARERKLSVVSWDTDAVPEARQCFVNQVDPRAIASTLIDIVAGEIGGSGKVALISGTETAANQNTWMAHMRTYAAEKYPKLSLLDPPEYPGEDDARSYQAVQGLLRRPDRPDAVIGMTSVAAPAAAKAVFDAKLAGKVAVTGITLPSSLRQYLKNGTVKRFVLWNPVDLGYLTVHVARRLAAGELSGAEVEAGRLGKLPIKDGQVVLGPPLVFDASNVERYEF